MKIIGQTEDGYVLTANHHEVANLTGYFSHSSSKRPAIKVGDVIEVAKMFRHLYDLERAKVEISDMAAKLRTAADLIGTLPNPVSEAEAKPDYEETKQN